MPAAARAMKSVELRRTRVALSPALFYSHTVI